MMGDWAAMGTGDPRGIPPSRKQVPKQVTLDRNAVCVLGLLTLQAIDTLRLAPRAYDAGGKAIANALLALGVPDETLAAAESTAELRDLFAGEAR